MSVNFKLLRTDTADKRPTAAQLSIGELGLNYDAATPGLFFEDDAGSVRKLGPMQVSSSAPNASPAGSSGNSTGELWLDNSSGHVLKYYTGSSWASITNAGTAGSDTQVTFNDGGSLSGDSTFTFNKTTDVLSVTEIQTRLNGSVGFQAKSASALARGDVLFVSSVDSGVPVVKKADADDAIKIPAVGICDTVASASGDTVYVIVSGYIENVDTDTVGYSLNDELFLSTTTGGLTTTAPTGESSIIQHIGTVVKVDSSAGVINVNVSGVSKTPNLNNGNIFIGNASNQAITDSFLDVLDDQAGISSSASSTALTIASGGGVTLASTLDVTGLTTFTAGASGTRKLIADNVDITGNTSYSVTGIPSWATRITVIVMNISLTSNNEITIRLGTSSGDVTTGYDSSSDLGGSVERKTDAFVISANGSDAYTGRVVIEKGASNLYVSTHELARTDGGGGSVTNGAGILSGFSGTIDRVTLRSGLGQNTFDGSSKVTVYAES